ncbi:MAG TPA: hypothetical protein VFS21_26295 [Roseiflexaceae bacterium]|nr:hypothetical protein [Roseiflexaceae bacterium]
MPPMIVSLDLPAPIAAGLRSGVYERVGGVIRTTETKQVVLWLRETGPAAIGSVPALLTGVGAAASILSLGISVAGFAVLSERLSQLDARLALVQQALDRIERRVSVLYDAQIRAAFAMAHTAFSLGNADNRRASALLAIDRLLVAQHQLVALASQHLMQETQTADEYLLLLMLAHLTEVRCLLELEEQEHAQTRLRAGLAVVRPRVEHYLRKLLTDNPAIYLQPALAGLVSLERLAQIYRWLDPAATHGAVFEQLREQIFALQPAGDAWIRALPARIWDPALFSGAQGRPRAVEPQANLLGSWPKQVEQLSGALPWNKGIPAEQRSGALQSLAQAVADMETMIETYQRFASYQDEIQSMRDAGLTFQQWRALLPEAVPPEATVVYLLRAEAVPQA